MPKDDDDLRLTLLQAGVRLHLDDDDDDDDE